ncbi:MAG TPA: VOC family protein [Gemmatimonadaceae bacterium]|jgi:catechol-2,3-dioxygenase|nr:VOC family protein [Gemmatimonadaceae bacterium]
MLGAKDATATVAVKDLGVAKKFYEGSVGLKPLPTEQPEVVNYKTGNSTLLVYRSQFAGTNKATAVTWSVDNTEEEVRALRSKGVVFEHYDMPGATLKGDVHVMGSMKAAWFKDPDGNILAIVGG